MNLNILWFLLIAILYAGFFFLEGFDFGVGILLPWLGRNDTDRRLILNTIGPHWDGNEVWLITAAGATFAAFPGWYAAMFSGFYALFFLVLVSLILRGVAFEFREKRTEPAWRWAWDAALFLGSLGASFLFGVLFSNLVVGVPLNGNGVISGGHFFFFNIPGLLGGFALVSVFALHGANFLSLKLNGEMIARLKKTQPWLYGAAVVLIVAQQIAVIVSVGSTGIVLAMMAVVLLALAGSFYLHAQGRDGWAFLLAGAVILLATVEDFALLFPNVLISAVDPAKSLTIYTASSSAYTLTVMTIAALVFVPIVLAYQLWTYRVFRGRLQSGAK